MIVYAATKNAGKLRELQKTFAHAGWDVRASRAYAEVEEGEVSYAANAALKARALCERLGGRAEAMDPVAGDRADAMYPVLGDDSGLEVAALDGRPGVLSARYGGTDASWAERRAALLAELKHTRSRDRSARFVCALHFIDVDGRELAATGTYDGTLAERDLGEGGFSYDPIFVSADGRTFAQLSESEKNATSHRARAAHALLAALRGIDRTADPRKTLPRSD